MNKKTKFVLSTFVAASTVAVACSVLAAVHGLPTLRAKGTDGVDSWTEKAYVAPTGSDVGYKHYYLGCPGNARTSDASHLDSVSLEDITIPALNVIQSSEVAEGSEILNINEAKIKFCDQSIDFNNKDSGGHAVFVSDQGHQAVFFSRSNNLGEESSAHPTEFRFSKSLSNLTAITFEYRYLDYNSWHPASGEDAHIFTQVKVGGDYPIYKFDFINDDAWHTGTISYANLNITDLLFKIYDMQGHLYISNIRYFVGTTAYDEIAPITISDLGLESGVTVPQQSTASHIFKDYDYKANKGIDLWFKPHYSVHAGDWCTTYLFNGQDEDGIVFRYDFGRTEDDGIVRLYIYTTRAYEDGTTVVAGAGNDGTYFWFPRSSGVKSTADVVMHMFAYCVDEATNKFTCGFTAGVAGGTQYYPTSNDTPEDTSNTPMTFDIVLGANYFDGGAKRKIRFSSTTDDYQLYDAQSAEPLVVYKDAAGALLGKQTGGVVNFPAYSQAGKTLLGWYDQQGRKVANGQTVTGKTIVQPLFVDTQTDMIVPSTLGLMAAGEEFVVNPTTVPSEASTPNGYTPSDNRFDMYLMYQVTHRGDGDKYAITGLPYDFIDGTTRAFIRINENSDKLDGYVYGGSLGGAGADNTYFNIGSSFRRMTDRILIHISVDQTATNSIYLTLEFINMRTRESSTVTKNIAFESYSIQDGIRNKMGFMVVSDLEYRISDAF